MGKNWILMAKCTKTCCEIPWLCKHVNLFLFKHKSWRTALNTSRSRISNMSFNTVVFVLAALAAVAAASDKVTGVPTVTFCSVPGAWLQNVTYTLNPQNIMPGTELNITVSGMLTQTITKATLQLTASFDGIPIVSKKENVCHMKKNPFPCPVKAGPLSYAIQHKIPNVPISGAVEAKAVLTSQTGAQVVCVKVNVNI
jgi:hypothetical protein